MPRTHEITAYAQRLILEYNRARKLLRKYFKKRHDPDEARAKIKEIIGNSTRRQSKIIGYTLNDAFRKGTKECDKELSNATISAAAPSASMGFDMSKVSVMSLNTITKETIGDIGKYNTLLSKQLIHEYDLLLADNKLVNSLTQHGWTPWLDEALRKRGIKPEVIALAKGQTTTRKVIDILEMEGIRGGKHPREVSKMILPHIQRHFGPEGVVIDNIGKFKKVLKVDADGNFKYVKQAVTRPYRATHKSYSNLLARSSMLSAHHEGRYQSLEKTGLVDHYISVSILDANTCSTCAGMHGRVVSKADGPLYHPSCACDKKPIWKKDSGLKNKDPAVYEKQRDQHFWKQQQLADYNKNMPRGAKLKYHSMLPKDALMDMPGKEAMRAIRYDALGKQAGIKPTIVKPKITKVMPKTVTPIRKKDPLTQMKYEERAHADELWKKTDKDGFEHIKLTNSKTTYADGNKNSVAWSIPNGPFKARHTHPEWDSPLSGADLANFLTINNMKQTAASSPERVYVALKRKETSHPWKTKAAVIDDFKMTATEINKEKTMTFFGKEFRNPTKMEAQKIWHDANDEANKLFAKQYNYEYISFTRK